MCVRDLFPGKNRAVLDSNDGTSVINSHKVETTKQFSKAKELEGFEKGNKALDKLSELGIGGVLFAHDVAMTVEEQGKALDGLEGVKTKNLFLRVRCNQGKSLCGMGLLMQGLFEGFFVAVCGT